MSLTDKGVNLHSEAENYYQKRFNGTKSARTIIHFIAGTPIPVSSFSSNGFNRVEVRGLFGG